MRIVGARNDQGACTDITILQRLRKNDTFFRSPVKNAYADGSFSCCLVQGYR